MRERERVCVCVWGNLGKLEIRVGCGLVIDSVKDRPWSSGAKLQTVSSMTLMEREKLGESSSTTFGSATKMAIATITTT